MDVFMFKNVVKCYFLFICADVCFAVSNQVLSKTLYDDLFADYDSNLIPLCSKTDQVTLNMDVALRQVMDVEQTERKKFWQALFERTIVSKKQKRQTEAKNEREQLLTTNIWLRLTWNDCRLTWDTASYNNISTIMVSYSNVWIPDITLYDSAAEEVMFPGREDCRVSITSTGNLTYNFPTVAKSICRVNVRFFPFDTQQCRLQFGSWSHHGNELNIVNRNPQGDIGNFIDNSEWKIKEVPAERHVLYYNCCPEPYPDVTFYVVMERRPAFYLLTVLFPCILTSCVAAAGFLLPVESGEKVSLAITVLLSLAVFLLVVSESLPPSSDNFPIIGSYFAASMVLVSLSLCLTVVIVNVFYRGTTGRTPPRWAKLVCFKYIGRLVGGKSYKLDNVQPLGKQGNLETDGYSPAELKLHSKNTDLRKESNGKLSNQNHEIPNGQLDSFVQAKLDNGRIRPLLPSLEHKDSLEQSVKEQITYLKSIDQHFKDCRKNEEIQSEWRDIAIVLDRLFLILYVLITVITTLAFLMQCV